MIRHCFYRRNRKQLQQIFFFHFVYSVIIKNDQYLSDLDFRWGEAGFYSVTFVECNSYVIEIWISEDTMPSQIATSVQIKLDKL